MSPPEKTFSRTAPVLTGVGSMENPDAFGALQRLRAKGGMTLRIYESIPEVTGGTRFDSCECFHVSVPTAGAPSSSPRSPQTSTYRGRTLAILLCTRD